MSKELYILKNPDGSYGLDFRYDKGGPTISGLSKKEMELIVKTHKEWHEDLKIVREI